MALRVAMFVLMLWPLAGPAAADQSKSFSFGVVPQLDQRRLAAIWQPILGEVSRRTGIKLELTGAPRIEDFEKRFLAGQYDFAYMNPYHARLAARRQGYLALVRDHGLDLHGVIVVRRESPIRSPRDLAGKILALPSPNALGASLLVRADLDRLFHVQVQPRYVQTHNSVYLQVAQGLSDAGGGVQSTLDCQPQALRDRLRVIYTTSRVPAHPLMVHPRVPGEVQASVRRALLEMGKTVAGKALLAEVPIQEIGPASVSDYDVIEKLEIEKYSIEAGQP